MGPSWNMDHQYHEQTANTRNYLHAPVASDPTVHNVLRTEQSYRQSPKLARSHLDDENLQTRQLPSVADLYTNASAYPSGSDQRHTPSGRNLATTSPPGQSRQTLTSPWHGLPFDPRAHQKQTTPAPLSLQIPEAQQELPRISTDIYPFAGHLPRQSTATSLPSFASFQEQTNRDAPEEVDIAPMSARMICHCAKLNPLVRDVAVAVTELDEYLQLYSNKSVTKAHDQPKDNPVHTVQWVLERLTKAKAELQDAWRRGQLSYNSQMLTPYSGVASQIAPSPNVLKRPAWDHEDLPEAKRRQSVMSLDMNSNMRSYNSAPKDERRGSLDFASRSPPTESVPGSAYPRTGSPGPTGRSRGPLPSPSSLAFQFSSATPSAVAQGGQLGSPPTSTYQPTVSIHTASASSATSAHIADLQHQVTLKSLALQTLQSEYSSLLQKLQRERVKSQAIEKKTNVADQEVNDLTTRTEELTEQVKALESQIEASERKREDDRAQASREKDQWQRMLELGGRIQSKHAEEKQKLRDECDAKAQRLAAYESKDPAEHDPSNRSLVSHIAQSLRPNESLSLTQPANADLQSSRSVFAGPNDVESLKREISDLNSRVDLLRFALEEAQRHTQLINVRTSEITQRSGQIADVVQRALEEGRPLQRNDIASHFAPHQGMQTMAGSTSLNAHSNPQLQTSIFLDTPQDRSAPQSTRSSRNTSQSTVSSSSATLATITRAVSPGPAELGFHVTPSTSSPEELMRVLGPAPPPLAASVMPFNSTLYAPAVEVTKKAPKPKRAKQPRRQSVDVVGSWMFPRGEELRHDRQAAFQIGGFRPLSHDTIPHLTAPPAKGAGDRSPPHSHHSSPGPTRHSMSPDSTEQPKEESGTASSGQHLTAESYHKAQAAGFETAMPPPPRPNVLSGRMGNSSVESHERRPAF